MNFYFIPYVCKLFKFIVMSLALCKLLVEYAKHKDTLLFYLDINQLFILINKSLEMVYEFFIINIYK